MGRQVSINKSGYKY